MNFSTLTKSGTFQYVQKDVTQKLVVSDVEHQIITRFNTLYKNKGIRLEKVSEHLPFSFTIIAETKYSSTSMQEKHPEYKELVLSTGCLTSITDDYGLKCTRRGE